MDPIRKQHVSSYERMADALAKLAREMRSQPTPAPMPRGES